MKTDKQDVNHLSESEIVERGWTKAGILKFLGEPDWRPNFRAYGKTLQWRLYQEERILAMEMTDDWKIWRVKSEKRRESAQARALAKIAEREAERLEEAKEEQEQIQEYIDDIKKLKVKFMMKLPNIDKLRMLGESNWIPVANPDPSFKETKQEHSDRVTVNYLRHHCTNYDEILYSYNINDIGYPILSKKVHDLIGGKFPELQESCDARVAYSIGKSYHSYDFSDRGHYGGYYGQYEPKHLTSPEMQTKRATTMVSIEEQKRLGLL